MCFLFSIFQTLSLFIAFYFRMDPVEIDDEAVEAPSYNFAFPADNYKRAKSNNWMASMLEDLSERNDLEEPELKKIEEISLSLIICF